MRSAIGSAAARRNGQPLANLGDMLLYAGFRLTAEQLVDRGLEESI